MRKTCSVFISAMLLTTLWVCQASWAAQIYVTETRDILLRSSPSNQGRTITKMPVGLPVEVLTTQNDWSRIRITENDNTTKEGWIQSRFLGTHPTTDQALATENKTLKQKVAELENLAEQLKTTTEKLNKLQTEYDALARGSTNYIKIRDEYESVKTALTSAQESVQTLIQENENLKLSQTVKWFGAGAMVLLAGWLIGIFMGRTRKKRRINYHF